MVREMKRDCNTGTANEHYDSIGIVYHSLQSASVCNMYCCADNADKSGLRD